MSSLKVSKVSKISSFKVEKRQLLTALSNLNKIGKASKKKASTLEVTIYDGFIRLVIPGAELIVQAFTKGSAKFSMLLWYFTDIVKSEKERELDFTVLENELKQKDFTFRVQTTFFENDRILRSINLPANYKFLDVARLYLSEKYTSEEIKFNNLDKEVVDAINELNTEIDKVASIMHKYRFSRGEVEALILNKLKA